MYKQQLAMTETYKIILYQADKNLFKVSKVTLEQCFCISVIKKNRTNNNKIQSCFSLML